MKDINSLVSTMLSSDNGEVRNFAERLNVILDKTEGASNNFKEETEKLRSILGSEQKANNLLSVENRKLRLRVKYLERKLYGKSSEKDDEPSDGECNGEGDGQGNRGNKVDHQNGKSKPEADENQKDKNKGRAVKNLGENAERKDVQIEPKSTQCECGCEGKVIGTDKIERVRYQAAKAWIDVEHYVKMKCGQCQPGGKFWQAKVPPQLFQGQYCSNSLIAGLIVGKFADFLPMYRQSAILKRSGIDLHRSSLTRWTNRALLEALDPICEIMLTDIKKSDVLQMDETIAPTLAPGNGRVKNAYALALLRDQRRYAGSGPSCVVFKYAPTRAGLHIEEMLDGFDGVLQVDGYAGYARLEKETRSGGDPIQLAYCWAHVRRKFHELWTSNKCTYSKNIIDLIAKIAVVEKQLKGHPPRVREQIRRKELLPVLEEIRFTLLNASEHSLAKDKLGSAIIYTLKLWNGLVSFVNEGRLEVDNNNVENAIRKWVMCRKNCMFAGSAEGGKAWAIAASLIGTCALLEINPYEYLLWVLDQIARKLPRAEYWKLTPWEYQKRMLQTRKS